MASERRPVAALRQCWAASIERKNSWQTAEYLGDDTPYAMQHILGRAAWDADAVRNENSRYVREHMLTNGDTKKRFTLRCTLTQAVFKVAHAELFHANHLQIMEIFSINPSICRSFQRN
jgi:hypothetical protein